MDCTKLKSTSGVYVPPTHQEFKQTMANMERALSEVYPAPRHPPPIEEPLLPTDSEKRKAIPIASGVLDYFPAALAEVAKVSYAGNQKHNPGEPLHWARGKSMDQDDTILRHFLERGTIDPSDGLSHTAHLAWRVLALLQLELEAAGYPIARGAKEAK